MGPASKMTGIGIPRSPLVTGNSGRKIMRQIKSKVKDIGMESDWKGNIMSEEKFLQEVRFFYIKEHFPAHSSMHNAQLPQRLLLPWTSILPG